jgi:hypothetical protein
MDFKSEDFDVIQTFAKSESDYNLGIPLANRESVRKEESILSDSESV